MYVVLTACSHVSTGVSRSSLKMFITRIVYGIWYHTLYTSKVAAEQLAFPFRIREVLGSDLGAETG
jgi:hypothetical protein